MALISSPKRKPVPTSRTAKPAAPGHARTSRHRFPTLEPGSPDERLQVLTDWGARTTGSQIPIDTPAQSTPEAKEGTRCLVSASIKGRTKMSGGVRAALTRCRAMIWSALTCIRPCIRDRAGSDPQPGRTPLLEQVAEALSCRRSIQAEREGATVSRFLRLACAVHVSACMVSDAAPDPHVRSWHHHCRSRRCHKCFNNS